MIGRIFAVIFALLLLLPGLCTLAFGLGFATSPYGGWILALIWFAVGGLLTWGGIAILRATFRG